MGLEKHVSRKVLKNIKKGFLASLKKPGVAKEGTGEVAKKAEAEVTTDGPLKGKLVRIVEEKNVYLGRVVEVLGHAKGKLHGTLAFKEAMEAFTDKGKAPPKVCVDESAVLPLEQIAKPNLTALKSLRFKDEERAEAEELFPPVALEKVYKLGRHLSLPLLQMQMWMWLLTRDFELKSIGRIKLLNPAHVHQICLQMQLPDAAERFVQEIGTLSAELQSAQLILLPVWGDDPEHWTLLKVAKVDEKWQVNYKDSLSTLHKGCKENAEKLTTLLACALMVDLEFPKDRCNQKMQPKGSLECGFFVCHWLEESIREELSEGPFAIGAPNVSRVHDRLASCQGLIIKNKCWSEIHAAKAAKAKAALEEKKGKEEQKLAEMLKSKEYQELLHKENRLKALVPWATLSGCAKCRWQPTGSTCCNPEEMLARDLALKESSDGKLDKQIYEQKLSEVYAKVKADHVSPLTVTKLPEKGGGAHTDLGFKQKQNHV